MKNHTNIFSFMTLYKTLIGPVPLRIRFNKEDGFIRICDGTRYLKFLGLKNMTLFPIELDIL